MSTRSPVLQRIDELVNDLIRQLDVAATALNSTASPPAPTGERSSKRRKEQPPQPKLTIKPFQSEESHKNDVSFPTKAVSGVRRFTQYMRILELIQLNLIHGTVVTKRDVYYQCIHLFSSQAACDRIIDKVVTLLGCGDRLDCGIVASPRSLFSGDLTLFCPSSSPQSPPPDAVRGAVGTAALIPTEISAAWTAQLSPPSAQRVVVLVVEKEAVFRALLQLRLEGVVLVTGKGYPDCAARTLVKLLSEAMDGVRVVGLFDGDPFGVDIHRQYAASLPEARGMEWIGVDCKDFLPTPTQEGEGEGYPLVQLRNDERAKAVRMLRALGETEEDRQARRRLTEMLLTGYKVEIEAAYDYAAGGLRGYIEHKLSS